MLALVVLVVMVFGQVTGFGFVFDDDVYVSANRQVQAGLTLAGARWAFTTNHALFWHPLVWFSLMLDRQLFGPSPAGFHLTALLLHLANSLLLYWLIRRTTGSRGAGFAATLLFAIHPLRAESVAWVADRKDLLAAFFLLLTLLCYRTYVARPGIGRYLGVAGCHALALMSKPSVVALPLVLLVLDWWPLNRLPTGGPWRRAWTTQARRLLAEKAPLLLLSFAGSVVAYWAQASHAGVAEGFPVRYRIANALITLVRYFRDTVWPSGLAAIYPHPGTRTSLWAAAGAALLLVGATVFLFRWRRRPYLLAGWFWYLLMALPVIGLVQVGASSHADRYTYLPQIGLALALATAAVHASRSLHKANRVLVPTMVVVFATLAFLSHRQVAFWQDGFTLYRRAIAVTDYNWLAHVNLGKLLLEEKDFAAAEAQFRAVLAFHASSPAAHQGLALALHYQGRSEEALRHGAEAVRLKPKDAEVRQNFGFLLAEYGLVDEAIDEWRAAIALDPEEVGSYVNLGIALAEKGRTAEALMVLSEALRIDPANKRARAAAAELR